MEYIYNNARTLTKIMIIHDMEMIDREVDYEFEDYFDDFVEMAFIHNGDTIVQLFDGERVKYEGLADLILHDHFHYMTNVG